MHLEIFRWHTSAALEGALSRLSAPTGPSEVGCAASSSVSALAATAFARGTGTWQVSRSCPDMWSHSLQQVRRYLGQHAACGSQDFDMHAHVHLPRLLHVIRHPQECKTMLRTFLRESLLCKACLSCPVISGSY